MKFACFSISLLVCGAASLVAADFTGAWRGAAQGPDGGGFALGYVISRTGDATSGVLQVGGFGDFPMEDLAIESDTMSFHVSGDMGTWKHKGTLKDAAIEVTVTGPEGEAFQLIMTRVPAAIAGRWKASVEGPEGAMELVFSFKLDGEKLSGSVSGPWGEFPFVESKFSGNDVAWDTEWEGTRIHHRGKIDGDTISVQVESADWAFPMTLQREKPAAATAE